MSRHRADPDDEDLTPATSDTGPLLFGQGNWPPLSPPQPAGDGLGTPAQPDGDERHPRTGNNRAQESAHQAGLRTPQQHTDEDQLHALRADEHRRDVVHGDPPLGDTLRPDPPLGDASIVEDQLVEHSLVEAPLVEDHHLDDPADELGLLAPAPVADKGHRRGKRAAAPRSGGRRPLGVLLSLGVIAALVTGIFFGGRVIVDLIAGEPAADYSGQGGSTVDIEVPEGASTERIAEILNDNDVVASAEAFLDAAEGNPDVMNIQPGFYQMRSQMSGEAAVALILDPASRLLDRVTIPEGYTVARTLESLAEQTEIPRAEFDAAAAAVDQLGLPPWSNGQLEGFLYPETYEVGPDTTAVEILADMVAQFNQVSAESGLEANAAAVGLTPYEALTVASMVQAEVTVERERPLVARVIYNRLAQSIALGIDATLAYELGINSGELTTTEVLNTDSPYNTRTRQGLPPTPISNPGQPSIVGALNPAPGDWIYYVLQNSDGEHFFTASYEEFLAAKAQCEAAGLGCR